MPRFLFAAAALAAAALTTGCASTPSFAPAGSTNTATITGQSIRETILSARWKYFALDAVDSKRVSRMFLEDTHRTVVTVEAGQRRLVVSGAFNDGFGGPGPREATMLLVADIEAGKSYRLNGEVRDNLIVTWLEDAETQQKASAEASGRYVSIRSNPQFVPIFIPAAR